MSQFDQTGTNFQFRPRSAAGVQQRAQETDAGWDRPFRPDVNLWKPKAGDNTIRILPATWEGADYYGYDVYMNYGVGPDRRSAYLSIHHHLRQPDPLYEAYQRARREGNNDLEREFRATHRQAYWLIDRADVEAGPMLWPAPVTTFDRNLAAAGIDPDTGEVLQIEDPVNGFDVSFRKEGEGIKTRYTGIVVHRRPSPLHHDQNIAQQWLKYVVDNPIPKTLVFYPAERIKAAMTGETDVAAAEFAPPAPTQQPIPIPQSGEQPMGGYQNQAPTQPAHPSQMPPPAHPSQPPQQPAPQPPPQSPPTAAPQPAVNLPPPTPARTRLAGTVPGNPEGYDNDVPY